MSRQDADPLALQRVPDIAGPVVIPTEQHSSGYRKGN